MSDEQLSRAPLRLRLSRRRFMALTGSAGTGLVVAWVARSVSADATGTATAVAPPATATAAAAPPTTTPAALVQRTTPKDVDAWLSVAQDGTITLATGKVEFGQGIQTGFAQLVAEELDVPFAHVTVIMGITNRTPYDFGTVGSFSTRRTGPLVRQAAAEMRQWLLELGAQQLGVPIAQLTTKDGAVLVTSDPSQSATYAALAAGKQVGREFGTTATLKSPDTYTVIGQRIPRVDVPRKVTGEMTYGYDAMVPDMVHGTILHPPSLGATLVSVDYSQAEQMPGVIGVVRDGDFVGLAAQRLEQAQAALASIQATWKEVPSDYTSENLFQALKATKDGGMVLKEVGTVDQALGTVTRRVDAVYYAPYIAHGQIEPMTALVHVQPDQTEVWVSTQDPWGVQDSVARVLHLPRERVIVYPLMSGGAFGRKWITDDVPVEAARLSQAFHKPVRVNWTRPEEFQFDHFRPAMRIEISAGLSDTNDLAAWQYDLYATAYYPAGAPKPTASSANQGASVLDVYPRIANAKTTFYQSVAPLPPYYWRDNGGPINTFARECMVDELAEMAGIDPVSFRIGLLKENPRLLAVLHAAVQKAGWQPGTGMTGRGIGVAVAFTMGSYVAEVAQVAVDTTTGQVTVKHVDVALDCGLVVNPAAVESQVEGAVVMQGTSSTLKEAITFAQGRVTNGTFSQYAPLTFREAPSVDLVLVEDKTQPMQGVGEPPVEPVSAAIANAIYDAVGVRLRTLPFTPQAVKEALG